VNQNEKITRSSRFVDSLIKKCQQDKGFAANLRQCDMSGRNYLAWEFLISFGIDIENNYQAVPHLSIAAAIARAKPESNGSLSLGMALSLCYDDGAKSQPARARLRRLLACNSSEELGLILRPILLLVNSKCSRDLDYVQLLDQMLWFENSSERTKARWAQDFHRVNSVVEVDE
jgi:CRISPR system Cascade subunit CasB